MNEDIKKSINNCLAKTNPIKTIFEHSNDFNKNVTILYELGYISKIIYERLCKYGLYHDIGKCNDKMQYRLQTNSNNKKVKFDETIEVPHNILSFEMLDKNDFETDEDYYKALYIVLNHHSYIDNDEYITNPQNFELIKKTLEQFNLVPLSRTTIKKYHNYIENNLTKDLIFEKGLVHKCDYSASGETTIEYKNDFLVNSMNQMYIRRSFIKNDLQNYCEKNSEKNLCVVAQTGMGKTEAALLWGKNNKIIYFLPLKVSINAIFDRIKNDIICNENIEERLGLLHSNSLEKLTISKQQFLEENEEEYSKSLRHYNESKNLSLPLSISTIDQLFTFVYKYPTYEINVANLAISKIIIDEIQTFDAKLFADLVFGLEYLSYFNTKFLITTATLAPYLKDIIFKNIPFDYKTFIDDSVKRHNLKVIDDKLNAKDIACYYKKHKGKNLVICNTIKKAKDIAFELKNVYNLENVNLLHSEFIKKDRLKKEKSIIDCGATKHKENCIWVTTQIVEASLDIDFDYLFTEMSDLQGLFQRLGRVNRKGEKLSNEYNCFVYLQTNKKILDSVIDEAIYDLSCKAIKEIDGLLLESKKIKLIETYLTTDNLKKSNSKFLKDFKEEYEMLELLKGGELEKTQLRNIENIEFIPYSIYLENETFINENLKTIHNKKFNSKEHLIAKNNIMDLTMSVNKIKAYNNKYIGNLLKTIEISKYQKIPIYSCSYNFEIGIVTTISNNTNII